MVKCIVANAFKHLVTTKYVAQCKNIKNKKKNYVYIQVILLLLVKTNNILYS